MFAAIVLLAASLAVLSVWAQAARTNFVIMLADDLGFADVSYNGGPTNTSNISALASSPHTIHFTNFHSASSVCSPTRAAMLTGRHPERVCVVGANSENTFPILNNATTLAQDASRAGYLTGFFGKWHLGPFAIRNPIQKGFQNWTGSEGNLITYDAPCFCNLLQCLDNSCASRSMCVKTPFCHAKTPCYQSWLTRVNEFHDTFDCQMDSGTTSDPLTLNVEPRYRESCDVLGDRFEAFLNNVGNSPFLAYIAFNEPHMPYIADPVVRQMCETDESVCNSTIHAVPVNSRYSNYYGVIYSVDRVVGRVYRLLQESGKLHNTFILFNSDNGPEEPSRGGSGSAYPYRGYKRELYEGGHRVAGFVHWPARVSQNIVIDTLVSNLDLRPTILDILRLENPQAFQGYQTPNFDGVSFFPLFTQTNATAWVRSVPFKMCSPVVATIPQYSSLCTSIAYYEGNIKVIVKRGAETNLAFTQLFNLTNDPGESMNLVNVYPELATTMGLQAKAFGVSVVGDFLNLCPKLRKLANG